MFLILFMELEVTSDPIWILPKSTISDTCGRARSFTQYPEVDAVVKEQFSSTTESKNF